MSGKRVSWHGSMPAIVTPFAKDGALDEKAVRANVRLTVEESAHALLICGHNGEAHLMTEKEREQVIAWAVEEVAGRIPVVAGTGGINTDEVIRNTKAAKAAGADGAMIEAPYFMKPKAPDLIAHYARITDAVDLPIKVYNNPARSAVDITPAIMVKLAEYANIVSIKDSMGDLERIMHLIHAVGDRIRIFIGPAGLFGFAGVLMGADGFIEGLPQVAGRKCTLLYECAAKKDYAHGVPLQHELFALRHALAQTAGTPPSTLKDAMRVLGRPGGWPRMPLRPAEGKDLDQVRKVLADFGLTGAKAAE